MDNETLASLLRGRNRAGQPVDATANIIGPAMSALGNTIYGAGRGALTAMAGLPGDINQLITDNLGTLVNAQGLPTTKDIQDFLPLKPTTYEGKLAQKLGEFVPVNPTPIAKGAVAIAKPVGKALGKQAYQMTEDMLQKQGMMPSIVAYHGTPHNIEGAFDISKVGTGEGAQAYGHGMYYAEAPDVAKSYMGKTVFNEPTLDKFTNGPNYYTDSSGKHFKVRDYVRNDKPVEVSSNEYNSKFKEVSDLYAKQNQGNLYKVDIPDEYVPNMLDWDKPINQQTAKVQELAKQLDPNLLADTPHLIVRGRAKHWTEVVDNVEDLQKPQVIKLLKKLYGEGATVMPYGDYLASQMTGKQLYRNLSNPTQWSKEAAPYAMKAGMEDASVSARLNKLGIKGIRYKDAMSRDADEGTSNFVVFDPKEVKILEKNSKPVSRKDIIEEQINKLEIFNPNMSMDEFKSLAEKGQMRQARTFDQDVKDVINKKMPANIFELTGKNAYDYESGNFVKKLEKAGLYVDDDKFGTVIAGKTKKDVERLKQAQTPIEHGLSYGYKPEDIAKFYVNRRGNRADIGYAEFLDDLKQFNKKN